jgi:FtsH-binding integral membrane protein
MKISDIESSTTYSNDGTEPMILYSPEIKRGFVRKVYSILALQLLVTTAMSSAVVSNENLQLFVLNTNVFVASIVVTFVSVCAITCYSSMYPWNIILLGVFTLAESIVLSRLCLVEFLNGNETVVIAAAGITFFIFLLFTFIAFFSKRDFSFMENMLSVALISLLGFMFFQFFIQTTFLSLLIGWSGVLLFSAYILYDTSQLLHRLGPDDAIHASLMLYLDVINVFVFVLNLLRESSD